MRYRQPEEPAASHEICYQRKLCIEITRSNRLDAVAIPPAQESTSANSSAEQGRRANGEHAHGEADKSGSQDGKPDRAQILARGEIRHRRTGGEEPAHDKRNDGKHHSFDHPILLSYQWLLAVHQ